MDSTCFSISLLLAICATSAANQRIEFVVHVPGDTPADAKVFVAGSVPSLGNWRPDGLPLTRQPNGTYTGEVEFEAGQSIEFKITRGTWTTVEQNADGNDRPNRMAAIDVTTQKIEVTVARWANGKPVPRPPNTIVGTLKLHSIDSRNLKQSRTIRVWLPPGYDATSNARYDVLYMHDGQNCFDRATSAFGNEWEIDESLTKLIAAREVPPLIVVGIDNGLANRISELTFTAEAKRGGGQAAAYTAFLLEEVKPFIERTYRTNTGPAHTFLGGSSLGGLISLEIARRHPSTFGGVIAMSPALLWADEALTGEIERDPAGLRDTRVWLDMGTREGGYLANSNARTADPAGAKAMRAPETVNAVDDPNARIVAAARRLAAALSKHHIAHRFTVDVDHPAHNEPAWAARFPAAIRYLVKEDQTLKTSK